MRPRERESRGPRRPCRFGIDSDQCNVFAFTFRRQQTTTTMTNPSAFRYFGLRVAGDGDDQVAFKKILNAFDEEARDDSSTASGPGDEEGRDADAVCWSNETKIFIPLRRGLHGVQERLREGIFQGGECDVSLTYPLAVACCMQLAIKGDTVVNNKTLEIERAHLDGIVLDLNYVLDDTSRDKGTAVGQSRYVNLSSSRVIVSIIPWTLFSLDVEGADVTLQEVVFFCVFFPGCFRLNPFFLFFGHSR